MKENSNSNNGINFFGLLTILFIGLKLTGYIDWSWWWVLSPLWGGLAILLALFVIVLAIRLIPVIIAHAVRKIHFYRHARKIKK